MGLGVAGVSRGCCGLAGSPGGLAECPYQIARLPDCWTARLPDCPDFWSARLLDCRIARLPDCQIARLRDCRIAQLPDSRIARLPDCRIARLPDCQIARLPDCWIAGLLDCLIADIVQEHPRLPTADWKRIEKIKRCLGSHAGVIIFLFIRFYIHGAAELRTRHRA